MPKQIERIQVTFNILDPDQERLYRHVYNKINSSGYLKRLAQRDMDVLLPISGGHAAPLQYVESDDEFTVEGFI